MQKLCFHDTVNLAVVLQIYFYFELLKRTDETQMRALVLNAQTYGTRFGGFDKHFLALPASLSDYYDEHATLCLLYAFSLKDFVLKDISLKDTSQQADEDHASYQIFESILSNMRIGSVFMNQKFQRKEGPSILQIFEHVNDTAPSLGDIPVPVPLPLSVQLVMNDKESLSFVINNQAISTSFLVQQVFDEDQKESQKENQALANFENSIYQDQLKLFQPLKTCEIVHIADPADEGVIRPVEKDPLCVENALGDQYWAQFRVLPRDSRLFGRNSGCYQLQALLEGLYVDFSKSCAINYGAEQIASFEEIRRIRARYDVQLSVPLLKPYYLHLLQDGNDPVAALQYLLYVNQCPRNAVDLLNKSAETLSMCLKKLTVRLFCADLSKQDFVSCYRFLVETQSMFSRSDDGRKLTDLFKIIEDVEVVLRGIAMNFSQPSTAGPLEAAKMLAFLGDMNFVQNILSYLTSYRSNSQNKALIFLNLSPLLVHYVNFCGDPSAVHCRVLEAFRALVSDELEQSAVV